MDFSLSVNLETEREFSDFGSAFLQAAKADNGYSMQGINPVAKIMPVKVLDSSGYGDMEKIALGIKYAVDHGAKVINLSLGGEYSRTIEHALKDAAAKNVMVVVAVEM